MKASEIVQAMIEDTARQERAHDELHQFSDREKCKFALELLNQLHRQIVSAEANK